MFHPSIIASILTALVTISVLVGNNAYQRKRDREKLLTEKLEELYKAFTLMEVILTGSFTSIDDLKKIGTNLNHSMHNPRMLVRLYFRSLEKDFDGIDLANLLVLESSVNLPYEMDPKTFESHRQVYVKRTRNLLDRIERLRVKIHEDADSLTERDVSWYY